MRRPTSALSKAILGTALTASTLSAQTAPPVAEPPGVSPMAAARGARHLLRNGWDYISYQEYERALAYFREAEAVYEALGTPFFLAVTQLEHAESLEQVGPSDEADALRAAAREVFQRLGAQPWLERADRSAAGERPVAVRS